jgi:hypothetical protein
MHHQQQQTPDSGLNGPRIVTAVAGPNGETWVSQTSSVPTPLKVVDDWGTGPVPPISTVAPSNAPRRLGRTDVEWFGPLLPKVDELRAGVKRFGESLKMEPHRLKDDGTVDGVEPEVAADVIGQAMNIVLQQQIPIAAMIDLLGQSRFADFMDVLLPDAPQPYRDDVAQLVIEALSGDDGDEDEDGEEGEDEDEDGEEAEDGAQQLVKPVVAPKTKPASRARA